MVIPGPQGDRLHRLRMRLTRELLAEAEEIERLEQAVRELRVRHGQLQEAFEEELRAMAPAGPAVAAAPRPAASKPAAEMKPAGEPQDERVLADARRFARLLVSELALYNPSLVDEGRRNRDLYQRLKSGIDRSRQAYEQRFSSTVARRFDFFYEELVRTLAANDPSLLGPGYPGSSV